MNPRGSSTRRLMVAVGLVAVALGLLRARDGDDWRFGELTGFSAIGLLATALMLSTAGRPRRFFGGAAVTGFLVGLAFWVGPHPVREFVLSRVIEPLDGRLASHSAGMGMTHLQASLILWIMETPETRRVRPTRSPFWSRESQEELACLELAVALGGGLLAAAFRPPRPARDSPPLAVTT